MDERLDRAVKAHNVVFVVGSGVSAAGTNNDACSTWAGLIESGIQRALDLGSSREWGALVRTNVDFGFSNDDLAIVLSAASTVTNELNKHDPYAYTKWLADTVGNLKLKSTALASALRALPFPLLTTNYDTLLETPIRGSAVWTRPSDIQAVLAGTSSAIGHLHGLWSEPDSIVLSDGDYDKLLRSEVAQALQGAASTVKSLVYVGFGAGLADPNFERMIKWHKRSFVPSSVDHFRLCRNSELADLVKAHGTDHIRPIAYGESYEDLVPFLQALTPARDAVILSPAGIARDVVGEVQQAFSEDLVGDAIIGETLDSPSERHLEDVILPPVLLPVPQADFVRSRVQKVPGATIERLDPANEVRHADVIILAAEESSGLTTALRWMALEGARYLGSAAPLYVPFQRCRKVDRPLREQIRHEALAKGLLDRKDNRLPPYVLALDDFSPFVGQISDRVIEELGNSEAVLTIIGCERGVEDEVLERLSSVGVRATVRYLGRLSAADVREFARLALPSNYETLTEQILEVLQAENLPRTPFTVALLISVIIRGGILSTNASQTSILDDYVGLLLGRGDPHDDARFGLDQTQREAILGGLAEAFVETDAGGLEETDVTRVFQTIFDRFGWDESPTAVLASFLDRKVLRRDGRYIAFFRSSFLHLFAAKRAILDERFRGRLLERPIFYGSAITDYAALYRHDDLLLGSVAELLADGVWSGPRGGVFEKIGLAEPRALAQTHQQVLAAHEAESQSLDSSSDEMFDLSPDDDRPPFPTTDEENVPPGLQLVRTLQLVSAVLRDSDQIENLDLKRDVLVNVLAHWGKAMNLINSDRSFRDFLRTLLDNTEIFNIGSEEAKEETLDELAKAIPAAVTLGGITLSLASRKLIVIMNRAIDDGSVKADEETTVSAAFFIFALQEGNWPEQLSKLLDAQGNIWIVRNFLYHLVLRAFYADDVAPGSQQDTLLLLCVDIVQRSTSYPDKASAKVHREQLIQDFKANRLLRRTQRLVSEF